MRLTQEEPNSIKTNPELPIATSSTPEPVHQITTGTPQSWLSYTLLKKISHAHALSALTTLIHAVGQLTHMHYLPNNKQRLLMMRHDHIDSLGSIATQAAFDPSLASLSISHQETPLALRRALGTAMITSCFFYSFRLYTQPSYN